MSFEIRLVVHRDGASWLEHTLDRSPVTIGRAPSNDVVLAEPTVSQEHAMIAVSRGRLWLRDTSSNGTFVQGERVTEQTLEDHDVVHIPPFSLRFSLHEIAPTGTLMRQQTPLPAPTGEAPEVEPEAPTADQPTAEVPSSTPLPEAVTPILPSPPSPPITPPLTDTASPPRGTPDTAISPAEESTHHPEAEGPTLEVVEGPPELRGRRLTIDGEVAVVGRGAEADIRFDSATISRRHARLSHHASGGWRIEDLGSANGTFVDGQRVVSSRLGTSHRIRFGAEVMTRFRLPENAGDSVPIEIGGLEIDLVRAPGASGVLIMRVDGRVDRYSYSQLGRRLQSLIDSGEHRLVLDLAGVAFIDHTGLGVLVSAATAIDRVGGRLRLVGVGEPLRRALSLSRLDMFFRGRIAGNLETAVRALEGPLSPASRQPPH